MRLIDVDAFLNYIVFHTDLPGDAKEAIEDEIENFPIIELKTGKWVMKTDRRRNTYGECSNCGFMNYAGHTNFCPECGAMMEK